MTKQTKAELIAKCRRLEETSFDEQTEVTALRKENHELKKDVEKYKQVSRKLANVVATLLGPDISRLLSMLMVGGIGITALMMMKAV